MSSFSIFKLLLTKKKKGALIRGASWKCMKGAKEFDLDITQVFIVTMLRLLLKTAKRKNLEAEKMVIFWFSVFNRHSVWGVGNILDLLPTRFFFFLHWLIYLYVLITDWLRALEPSVMDWVSVYVYVYSPTGILGTWKTNQLWKVFPVPCVSVFCSIQQNANVIL